MMSWNDPYRGRRHQSKLLKEIMRQPSQQPSKDKPVSGRGGIGDVKDAHLTGQGGPYSAAHAGQKK
jgi:hypothetical protein